MDAAMEMAKRNGCMFFEVIGTNKYVTKICTRREFTLVNSIKYAGNDDSIIMAHFDSSYAMFTVCNNINGH